MEGSSTGNRILSWELYPVFMPSLCLFASTVCDAKLALNCTFASLHATCCPSFVAVKILLLSLTFSSLTTVCPGMVFSFIYLFIFQILKSLILTCVPKHEPSSHLPPHNISLGHPHAPAPSMLYPASDIDWRFNSYMIVYMLECHSPKSSHPLPPSESKSPLYTSVSFLLSCIQGRHCHLSKFHIYVLVYCIGVFLSGLLHSV